MLSQHAYEMISVFEIVFSTLVVRFFLRKRKIFEFGKLREHEVERVFFEPCILGGASKIGGRKICMWKPAVLYL